MNPDLNSIVGQPNNGASFDEWSALTLLAERRVFRLWTVIRGGRRLVLKGLRSEYCYAPEYRALLERELALTMRLDHPNIVRVEGMADVAGAGRCVVMEWIDGRTFGEFCADRRVSSADRRRVALEIADALAYAHQAGVCHRDLKPDNVLITRRGAHAKVIDFGLADADDFIGGKSSRAPERYGAPEQTGEIEGVEVDGRADVWAYGRLLADLNCGFKSVIAQCAVREPEKRPSMQQVVEAITSKSHRPWRLLRVWIALIIVAVVAIIALFLRSVFSDSKPMKGPVPAVVPEPADSIIVSEPVEDAPTVRPEESPELKPAVEREQPRMSDAEQIEGVVNEAEAELRKICEGQHEFIQRNPMDIEGGGAKMNEAQTAQQAVYERLSNRLKSLGLSQMEILETKSKIGARVMEYQMKLTDKSKQELDKRFQEAPESFGSMQ